jgi:hypothetical protein
MVEQKAIALSGRPQEPRNSDRVAIGKTLANSRAGEYGVRSLVQGIVQSDK